ncbi:MAG: exodeoxyribonuclease VII small subunit [Coriobacteriales bacterium]|nr:exodeoxyribonuclease VII small subunit [Coriobacteriales bacterium]MBQ6585243.1 exodeoxyribonuclease VII small subunit [Coriobacteriales bacterium]
MATLGNEPKTFGEIQGRLDEILLQVRSKEASLEKSLDLYEEALRLANAALEHIGDPELSDAEQAQYLSEKAKQEAADVAEPPADDSTLEDGE